MSTAWSRALGGLVLGGLLVAGSVWWVEPAASDDDAVTTDSIGDQVQTRRGGALPAFAERGELGQLYRFAKDRGDVLKWMPCTCGCARLGHTSNRSCYVKAESGERTTWTSHAAT
jgi:uncharacterized protein with PCYCGC motif